MKKIINVIALVCISTLVAATVMRYASAKSKKRIAVLTYDATRKTGDVNVYENVSVFTDATPVLPYTTLGEVTVHSSGGFGNDSYNSQRSAAIKKMKKQYPTADGILISFKENGACNAVAIMFK